MEENKIEKRRAKNGILANAKTDPKNAVNDAEFCGKITNIYKRGRETSFTISCGFPGMKRDEKGKFQRNLITVKFFDAEGDYYANNFHVGDFAIVKAVAQTRVNRRYETRTTEFWGQSIESNKKLLTPHDVNDVRVLGRITKAWPEGEDWISVMVKTQIWKTRPNVLSEDAAEVEDLYRSTTRIRVSTPKDAKRMAELKFTKGTNVEIIGHVYGRVVADPTGKRRLVETIIADQIHVVGDIQRPEVDPVTEVHHPENVGLDEEQEELKEAADRDMEEESVDKPAENTESSLFGEQD